MTPERVAEIASALGVIAAIARERMPVATDDGPEAGELACLHGGGLFRPLAMVAGNDTLRVVDAGAKALRIFSSDGVLLETVDLHESMDTAALGSDGQLMIASGRKIKVLWSGYVSRAIELPEDVVALSFATDGQGYALTRQGVHDALSGKMLFQIADRFTQIAVAGACFFLGGDHHVQLLNRDGAILRRLDFDGDAEAIAATDNHVWIATRSNILRIEIATGRTDRVASPEQITAMATRDSTVWLAGANLGARLSVFDGAAHHSGALYRWMPAALERTPSPQD
jgi:hypothetical protein